MNNLVHSTVMTRTGAASRRFFCAPKEQGVALAIVVWFLAAMALLVSGIVYQARTDTRLAQVHVAKARATAAGDGAINLFLAEYLSAERPRGSAQGPAAGQYSVGDHQVRIEMVPGAGLIDLRTAPRNLLVALFGLAPGVGAGEARTMADNVIKLRPRRGHLSPGRKERRPPLRAVEDLLRAEGVDRTVLDAVRDLVVVGGGSRSGADWPVAPPPVRSVLATADPEKVAALASLEANAEERDNKSRVRGSGSRGGFRVDALVRLGDQTWLRRRWVSLGSGEGLLPWRFNRTEAARVVSVE